MGGNEIGCVLGRSLLNHDCNTEAKSVDSYIRAAKTHLQYFEVVRKVL